MSKDSAHWYTGEQMKMVLNKILKDEEDILILDPIDAEQLGGETLTECLQARLNTFMWQESKGYQLPGSIIVPINLGNRHWVALCIHFDSINKLKPMIYYYDPYGREIHGDVLQALFLSFQQIDFERIRVGRLQLQKDGYNCGPWTILLLQHFVSQRPDDLQGVDIAEVRQHFDKIYAESSPEELKPGTMQAKKGKEISFPPAAEEQKRLDYHNDSSDEDTDRNQFESYNFKDEIGKYNGGFSDSLLTRLLSREQKDKEKLLRDSPHYLVQRGQEETIGQNGPGYYYTQGKGQSIQVFVSIDDDFMEFNLSDLINGNENAVNLKGILKKLSFHHRSKEFEPEELLKEFVKEKCVYHPRLTEEEKKWLSRKARFLSINVMIVHCIGDAIPHARNTSQHYYNAKNELGMKTQNLEELDSLLEIAIKDTLNAVFFQKQVRKFMDENKQLILSVAKTFKQNPLAWMREARRYVEISGQGQAHHTFSPVFCALLWPIENNLTNFYDTIRFKKNTTKAVEFEEKNLHDFILEKFYQKTQEYDVDLFYNQQNYQFKEGWPEIKDVCNKINKDADSPQFIKKLCSHLIKAESSPYQNKLLIYIDEEVLGLCAKFLQEQEDALLAKERAPTKKNSYASPLPLPPSSFSQVMTAEEALHCSFSKHSLIAYFRDVLIKRIVKKYHTKRPTLPVCHTFYNKDVISSLSNSRLSSRAVRRQILNNQEGLDLNYNFSRMWNFQNTTISEKLTLSEGGTREDYVDIPFVAERQDAYKNIAASLKKLIFRLNEKSDPATPITDKEIAAWIRQVYKKKSQKIFYLCDDKGQESKTVYAIPAGFEDTFYSALHSLELLLLHNECTRNRGSYIINQMFLDLVQHGKFSWDDLTTCLPMARRNAVPGSRYLTNTLFRRHLPFQFSYGAGPQNEGHAQTIFKAEAELIESWCILKGLLFSDTDEFIKQVHLHIKQHWYVGLDQLATELPESERPVLQTLHCR